MASSLRSSSASWCHRVGRRSPQDREGRRLDQDVVIAELRTGTTGTLIRSPLPAVFLSWLAREGDVVSRGWRIARLLPTED